MGGAERACIIGAGSSGIAAAKVLHERGIPFDAFEMGSGIGGLWRYENDSGRAPAYASLHINTSRDRTGFSDFPIPPDRPDFLSHRQLLAYFEDYVDHFGFRDRITFRTRVERVAPAPGGAYDVTVRSLTTGETTTARYGAVLVASGHHWDPYVPAFEGTFEGRVLHSSAYRTPEIFEGRRVLVVGVGNSGCDVACEAARVAEHVFLSTRRGAYIIPKYLLGRPLDVWVTPFSTRLPRPVQRLAYRALVYLSRGRQEPYFPTPDHPLGNEHPTVSSDLLGLIGHGEITVKPGVDRLAGSRVRFADGTDEAVDVIVLATGYNVTFPFFDADFIRPEENRLPLYRRVVPPEHPNLYFIGLIQPIGAVMPLAEAQSEWVADLLGGRA
ncbi:MAG: NAD(P)-binding domain-containing protein, partial [Rhodothermales bacterium]|nr:NAD(P)-binding domain-containing protein [Rhodothermales bacterium]